METRGYVVTAKPLLEAAVVVELLVAAASVAKWNSVFVEEGVMDPYRAQAEITDPPLIQQLQTALAPVLKDHNPEWQPTRWHFLRSIAGGAQQIPHRDYLAAGLVRKHFDEVPGGCILSLEKPAVLATYGWNVMKVFKKDEKMVKIPPGHAIVFRGELVHAGTKYTDENIRIHYYLDIDVDEHNNATEPVLFQVFKCANCKLAHLSNKEKKVHQKNVAMRHPSILHHSPFKL